jgi:integrase
MLPRAGEHRHPVPRLIMNGEPNRWFKRCLTLAGVADFPMHELRHHAGDEFRRAGNDLELTGVFMRHASISTTSDYYMHPDQDELVAGMQRAGARWANE